MRPTLVCCTPYLAWYPSGSHWTHADDCSVDPNQKLERKRPRGVVAARLNHPAGDALDGAVGVTAWLSHPLGCICVHCAYVSYWIDARDDEWEPDSDALEEAEA